VRLRGPIPLTLLTPGGSDLGVALGSEVQKGGVLGESIQPRIVEAVARWREGDRPDVRWSSWAQVHRPKSVLMEASFQLIVLGSSRVEGDTTREILRDQCAPGR